MEQIRFIANNLTDLDEALFIDLFKLKALNLNENQLVSLPRRLISPNARLEEINLSKNKLKDVFNLTEGNVLHKLLKFDLSFNNITKLTKEIQFNVRNLRNLNLSHNNFGDLEDITFIKNDKENFVA